MNRALIFVCCIILLFSCQSNPFDIEIEEKNIDFQFIRLDQEVFRSELDNPLVRQEHLLQTYPDFYKEYFEKIIRVGPVEDSISILKFDQISKEVIFNETQVQIDSVFFLDQDLREEFYNAIQYFHHYFPEDTFPDIVAMNSGFNFAVYPLKRELGIGLEFYLGQDHYITKNLPNEQFPNYQKEKMTKEYMLSDAFRGYLLSTNQDYIQGDKLVNHIVYQGKMMYALNALLPSTEECFQLGYKNEDLDWCLRNEFNIWKAIIDEDILFTNDFKQIRRFTGFGPFTQGFPEESPGMLSLFIGKQIVRDYMIKNPKMSLKTLFEKKDEVVLNTYKPNN